MLQLIKLALQQCIDSIDSGNSNINEQEQKELLNLIQKINSKELNKTESYNYIGVSRATFDNYIKKGLIPEGIEKQGYSNKFWRKSDLDEYLKNNVKNVRKRL